MIEEFTEEQMTRALVAELCSGRKFMEQNQKFREDEAAAEAKQYVGHKVKTLLGKHVLSIPQHEFFTMGQKYGPECWGDREFIRDVGRLNPHLRSNRV